MDVQISDRVLKAEPLLPKQEGFLPPRPNLTIARQAAARIYFDLRRQGLTIRSPIDCCIAQVALENNLLLVHNDRDFETIAQVRSLQNLRFQP